MKTLATTIVLLTVLLAAAWVALGLRAKSKYDKAKQETEEVYAVMPIDQPMTTFLAEVQSSWTLTADITNGADSDMIKLAGMTPSVRNLINVFTFQMPPYGWFSPSQNRKAIELALIKAQFMPVSLDKRWYLSEDQHLAVLHAKTNLVMIYRDEATGLRATMYVKKKVKAGASLPAKEKENVL